MAFLHTNGDQNLCQLTAGRNFAAIIFPFACLLTVDLSKVWAEVWLPDNLVVSAMQNKAKINL